MLVCSTPSKKEHELSKQSSIHSHLRKQLLWGRDPQYMQVSKHNKQGLATQPKQSRRDEEIAMGRQGWNSMTGFKLNSLGINISGDQGFGNH